VEVVSRGSDKWLFCQVRRLYATGAAYPCGTCVSHRLPHWHAGASQIFDIGVPENFARRFQAAVPFGGGGCDGRKSSPRFPSLPFTSPPRWRRLFTALPGSLCCGLSWLAADFRRGHLPFCCSTGHTAFLDLNCGWDVITFRFQNLVLVSIFWHCAVLCSLLWGLSTSEGLPCLFGYLVRYLVSVYANHTHGE